MLRPLLVFAAAAFFAFPAYAQKTEVCPPSGLSADANALTPAEKKELAIMCTAYFYGAFLCAPIDQTVQAISTYGKLYGVSETDLDPNFAKPGSWDAHIKANYDRGKTLGQPAIQARLNNWTQLASGYFTETLNKGRKMTGPVLMTYIRGPEFQQSCPYIAP